MLRKSGKYLADWYDEKGKRCRKAFTSRASAERFQRHQRKLVASKKARASAR